MKTDKKLIILVVLFTSPIAHAANLTVDNSNMQGWAPDDVRPGGTVAITDTFPKSGNGSLEINLANSTAKAGFANYWSPTENQFGVTTTLGSLESFSFDWYRSSTSTVADHFAPALKLAWWNDNNTNGINDAGDKSGLLVWERVYNDVGPAPTDAWQSENVTDGNFWQRTYSPGTTNEDFDVSLAEWQSSYSSNGQPELNGSTYIVGMVTDSGSGWDGSSQMAVDNIKIKFTGSPATKYNFEAIPEPSSGLIAFLGLVGICSRRRRSK